MWEGKRYVAARALQKVVAESARISSGGKRELT